MSPDEHAPATITATPELPTAPEQAPTARVIPFPVRRKAVPSRLGQSLQQAAVALDAAARRLDRQARDLDASRGGFELARRRLVAESERAHAIASDGARIAAAIEHGDLDALLALQRELAHLRPIR